MKGAGRKVGCETPFARGAGLSREWRSGGVEQ